MSGHSKWHNIQKTKGAQDAKRAAAFTKISKEMIVAVKEGGSGDPNNNSRLAAVIAKAKAANMPNDNIKRVLEKAAASGSGDNYETITYEGHGPCGVAVIVETMTDNRNRTAGSVRHHFDKYGGSLGTNGCVSWSFDRKGVIVIDNEDGDYDEDAVMMDALDAGADDFNAEDNVFEITTDPDAFNDVVKALEENIFLMDQLTTILDDPTGYGRIIRSADGSVEKIVEQRDANAEEAAVREVNSGAFWFDGKALMRALNSLNAKRASGENTKKEFYLTDALEEIKSYGLRAGSFTAQSEDIILGANDRVQLNALNELARHRELEKHMRAGVSIPCTDGVIICPGAKIGRDTVILTGSVIKGDSVIGEDCTIGPDSLIENSTIENGVSFVRSVCYSSKILDGADIGPFVRIRPGSVIGSSVHVGNFVEVKNSTIGADTKISHLSYIGDSDLGTGINIGCGCATANYSGNKKSRTTIKDGAFIGCHTCLVAPVEVGENAYTAAGSTVTENVPDNSLAVARSRQTVKKGWVKIKQPYKHKV